MELFMSMKKKKKKKTGTYYIHLCSLYGKSRQYLDNNIIQVKCNIYL